MALSYSDISVEIREVLLREKPDQLYEISSKGTVPVLILPNDVVLDESIDIMNWAIEESNNIDLFKFEIELQHKLIVQNDTIFKTWLDRYKYNERYDDYSIPKCQNKCNEILINYEKLLINNNYLVNNSISLCDIAIFPFVRQFYNTNINYFLSTYPNLNKWLHTIINSNLFISVMTKYLQWNENDNIKVINFKKELDYA